MPYTDFVISHPPPRNTHPTPPSNPRSGAIKVLASRRPWLRRLADALDSGAIPCPCGPACTCPTALTTPGLDLLLLHPNPSTPDPHANNTNDGDDDDTDPLLLLHTQAAPRALPLLLLQHVHARALAAQNGGRARLGWHACVAVRAAAARAGAPAILGCVLHVKLLKLGSRGPQRLLQALLGPLLGEQGGDDDKLRADALALLEEAGPAEVRALWVALAVWGVYVW
jgi:hypothetical protein